MVMLNVGANKGYNLAEWMQRYSSADVSNKKWHQLMMRSADPPCALQCCGVCLVCHRARMKQRADVGARLRLHAFELHKASRVHARGHGRADGSSIPFNWTTLGFDNSH